MTASTRTRVPWGGTALRYMLFVVVAVRGVVSYYGQPTLPIVLALLAATLLLSATAGLLSARLRWYRYLYFPAQTGLMLALSLQQPYTDFWGILYILLGMEAARSLPRRTLVVSGLLWAVLLTVTTALTKAWPDGLAVALTIDAAGLFVVSYEILSAEQERAQQDSQALLQRLQEAHGRLQEYAAQAEDIAAAEERNRLAHELRDSVNQQLFGITLAASSARVLLDRDPGRVPAQLEQLQEMTASALQQMRALITQLRPPKV